MVLSTSCRIHGGDFSQSSRATPDHDEDEEDAIDDTHGTASTDGDGHTSCNAGPAVADVPSRSDDTENADITLCLYPETKTSKLLILLGYASFGEA